MYNVIVLGTGPAGLTAALYLARAKLNPLVIEGPEPGGQLMLTTEVENFPGFPEGILGNDLIEDMRLQAKKFGAEFKQGWIKQVEFQGSHNTLKSDDIGELKAKSLVISTGASAKLLNIPGEKENMGRGVSVCATCDGIFFTDQEVIVIGGGDSAMEEALFLTKFAKMVHIVHRRNQLRASKIMQERVLANPKIKLSMNYTPQEILSDDGNVKGLKVKDNSTGVEEIFESEGVFVAIGHKPNTSIFKNHLLTDEVGYIMTAPHSSETSIPGVFACGDVQDSKYRQAITAAGSGCMAAIDCERYLETLLTLRNNRK